MHEGNLATAKFRSALPRVPPLSSGLTCSMHVWHAIIIERPGTAHLSIKISFLVTLLLLWLFLHVYVYVHLSLPMSHVHVSAKCISARMVRGAISYI